MGSKKQKKFTWVLENFCEDKSYYSRQFLVSGCNWRLRAYSTRHRDDAYLSLNLELSPSTNLRSGWRNVEFYLSLVNKGGKSNKVSGDERCFDSKHKSWGFKYFFLLYKLHDSRRGFMVNNRITIQAEIHVIPGAVTPVNTLWFKERNRVSDKNLDDDDSSEESATDDDDDDSSEESGTDDGDGSDDDDDDTYLEATMDDDASLDTADNFKNVLKETMSVNGFEVLLSQVEYVKRIFERHPLIAKGFYAKNQNLKNVCMNFLLGLIKTMSQSLEDLSNEDLVEADIALTYLKDAGFKVDWLEKKLDQLKENKEKEKSGLVRLQEIEEAVMKLKKKFSEMDALVEKEKKELSATRTPMSFDDLV